MLEIEIMQPNTRNNSVVYF